MAFELPDNAVREWLERSKSPSPEGGALIGAVQAGMRLALAKPGNSEAVKPIMLVAAPGWCAPNEVDYDTL